MEHEMNYGGMYTIHARVMQVHQCAMLVCDLHRQQTVLVHWPQACCFSPGEQVCISYNGMMTRSEPPQITADNVWHMPRC